MHSLSMGYGGRATIPLNGVWPPNYQRLLICQKRALGNLAGLKSSKNGFLASQIRRMFRFVMSEELGNHHRGKAPTLVADRLSVLTNERKTL